MADKSEDTSMGNVHAIFEKSGLTLNDLGLKMGYEASTARQAAWQFMKSGDPRISMLRRFAKALDIPLADLIDEKKSRSK
jgi:transcriptional regulator with XRE-family HTH domain